jgi:uncharacterized protein YciI
MLRLTIALILVVTAIHANAQSPNPKYIKSLADSLGADEYGMKNYILVILKKGTGDRSNQTTVDSLFAGHMKNIGRMVGLGKLVVAGPMGDNSLNYRGIFILNVRTLDEAKLLLDTDPAIKANLLDPELFQWYGSAALPLYLRYHDNVKKKNF